MRFLVRRLGFLLIALWAALTVNFFIPRLMPGNPAEAILAQFRGRLNPSSLKAIEVALGIGKHQNLLASYFEYLRNTLTGNFGVSTSYFPVPVTSVISRALPWSLGLVGISTVLGFLFGTALGAIAAWRRGGWLDNVLPPSFIVVSAFPYFWVGLLSIWLFSLTLNWFPTLGGYTETVTPTLTWGFIGDVLWHAVLPAFTILLTSIGGWILTMRNNMITVVAEDYVKMARAKGLRPRRILWQYAGRNALLPNLTGFAMSLGFVISGAILVEFVFNYPGVGFLLLQAVSAEDYPLMQALFLLITVAVLVAIFLSDVATALLDPRTRSTR
ncbi:MAG: ABC transporter permease [Acidobacteriota bacterium]|nr:ABC transporter permease [Acidobacteriota bacterium]MDE3093059.1 ABC transporter permease [Acidobacteriota bacterium]